MYVPAVRAREDPNAPPLKSTQSNLFLAPETPVNKSPRLGWTLYSPLPNPNNRAAQHRRMCGTAEEDTGIPVRRKQEGSQSCLYHQAQSDPGQVPSPPLTATSSSSFFLKRRTLLQPPPTKSPVVPGPQQSPEPTHLCWTRVSLVDAHTLPKYTFLTLTNKNAVAGGEKPLGPSQTLTGGVPQPFPVLLSAPQ